MLLDLVQINKKYNLKIKGVIHVGAHYGREFSVYQTLGIQKILFFEPVLQTFKILEQHIGSKAIAVNKAVGNENKKIPMYIETANEGQSSSILAPELHLQQRPDIIFHSKQEVDMVRLDDFINDKENYNFLNMDVQGYELEVLKGAKILLHKIDYILTEINRAEIYKDCAKIDELEIFLKPYGFKFVEENWAGSNGTWGDGFFIKN
jgi:FkbM family methyltransferase